MSGDPHQHRNIAVLVRNKNIAVMNKIVQCAGSHYGVVCGPASSFRKYLLQILDESYPQSDATEMQTVPHQEAVKLAMWGTSGKRVPGSLRTPFKWVRLIDCSTEHLCNILTYDGNVHLTTDYVAIIRQILENRGIATEEQIKSYAEKPD